jgi:hypothetical protein
MSTRTFERNATRRSLRFVQSLAAAPEKAGRPFDHVGRLQSGMFADSQHAGEIPKLWSAK